MISGNDFSSTTHFSVTSSKTMHKIQLKFKNDRLLLAADIEKKNNNYCNVESKKVGKCFC